MALSSASPALSAASTSPGSTSTDAPALPIAFCTASRVQRLSCSGVDTVSQ
ncbi:hypothetical protein [Actinoplanes palleronii]|uniref:hypothetical protein n=1 Tax=Actinoplanes palleronii TaxID=113570 RepID=UPI001EF39D85|nr:hypothetical protein [Actinoplanes palleronii]